MTTLREKVTQTFKETFGDTPFELVSAPGRVNLIGEHTDYNDGFVLPMAIDREVWIAFVPTHTPSVRIISLDLEDEIRLSLDDYAKGEESATEYVKGIAWVLQQQGYAIQGFNAVMAGNVPIGAGLSSSAALELAIAYAFMVASNLQDAWDASQMALLAQKAENEWLGVKTGIMDQMISASGKEGSALLIDCRSLDTEALPVPDNAAVIVLDTNTRRQLVTSAYNERRQQCEAAANYFGVPALRDVSIDEFEAGKAGLDAPTRKRAKHVITENDRVLQAKDAMLANDATTLGTLFNASHASLRDDFEVTNDALDTIVAIAQAHPACFGARMTGAGFGGCAVALVDNTQVDDFTAQVSEKYAQQTPQKATIYVTKPSEGASVHQ
ncbi:MAG: galactokinase [Chloroflexota bacterium]